MLAIDNSIDILHTYRYITASDWSLLLVEHSMSKALQTKKAQLEARRALAECLAACEQAEIVEELPVNHDTQHSQHLSATKTHPTVNLLEKAEEYYDVKKEHDIRASISALSGLLDPKTLHQKASIPPKSL